MSQTGQQGVTSNPQASSSAVSTTVFIGNLHPSTSEGDLIKLFARYGTVMKIDYMWHKSGPHRGQPRGFAFLDFSSRAEAEMAIKSLNSLPVKGRNLSVRLSCGDRRGIEAFRPAGHQPHAAIVTSSGSTKRPRPDDGDDPGQRSKSVKSIDDQMKKIREKLMSLEKDR